MGMGGSRAAAPKEPPAPPPPPERTDAPFEQDESKYFYVLPFDPVTKQNLINAKMALEVSPEGFRLLRADTMDPILVFPWGQIHSWAHSTEKFSFRFFEERGEKGLTLYSFVVKDVDELIAFMKQKIDDILMERKRAAFPADKFDELIENMKVGDPALRINYIQTTAMMNYFTSQQAKNLVAALDNSFDKVEAARILHERLVDQNHFNVVLDELDHDDDRENVWLRITQLKRASNNIMSARRLGITGTSSVGFRGSSMRNLPPVSN